MRSTRRDFLTAAVGASVVLASPRLATARAVDDPTVAVATFKSEPAARVPKLTVTARTTPSPGLLFVSTLTGPGQRGPIIVDDDGELVWFRRTQHVAINFRRQIYRGQPVLTWWEGTISPVGTGEGECVILDARYREIGRVRAGNGFHADVHEFLITPEGTALITIYDETTADLRGIGGLASHPTLNSIVQEVDIATGRVLFEWHSLDHVRVEDTFAPVLTPCDYFHVNSIDVDLDGNLIISARNTWGIYKIDRRSGEVIWRLGGKSSDFQLDPGVEFMYQHDARAHPDGTLTLYDDGPGNASHQSRALRVALNPSTGRAVLVQEFLHPTAITSAAMGNAQFLSNGNAVVGWGTAPFVTEFGPLGDVRFDAHFEGGAWNYRAFRNTWTGRPLHRPAIAVARRAGDATVYASFNGSTETAHWQLLGGATRNSLQPLRTVPRQGFETAITVKRPPSHLAVAALDSAKRTIATSRISAPD